MSVVSDFYFSVRGRIGRRSYWLFGFIPMVCVGFVLGLGLGIARAYASPSTALVLLLVVAFFVIWISVAVHAKRLHDIGLSAWWIASFALVSFLVFYATFSPLVMQIASLAIWIVVGALRGTSGGNRFGPDPLQPQRQEHEGNSVRAA